MSGNIMCVVSMTGCDDMCPCHTYQDVSGHVRELLMTVCSRSLQRPVECCAELRYGRQNGPCSSHVKACWGPAGMTFALSAAAVWSGLVSPPSSSLLSLSLFPSHLPVFGGEMGSPGAGSPHLLPKFTFHPFYGP